MRQHRRHRRPLWAVPGLLLFAACAPATPPPPGGGPATSTAHVVLAASATSAEPRPGLSGEAYDRLLELGHASNGLDGAVVAEVVGVNGQELPPEPIIRDLTPMRGRNVERIPDKRRDKVEDAVDEVASDLAEARSPSEGLDLLALLEQAAGQVNSSEMIVISSGVSTVDPLDFRDLGWVRDVPSIVQDLQKRELLPRSLQGKQVTFVGLGLTAGAQPRLAPPDQQRVKQLWLGICEAAGAAECRLSQDLHPSVPPVADRPVPVVPVRRFDTLHGVERIPAGACQTVVRIPDDLLFAANRADLLPEADQAIQAIAMNVSAGATVTEVAGHVANAGRGDGAELSRLRAETVAGRLISLGAPADRIRGVVGYGDTRPVEANFNPDGSFNEELAAKNRRVELTLVQANCSTDR